MDSLITAAGRALAAGDLIGALKRVALRDDAPALALRGIAMARLGELDRAKVLLQKAAQAFGPRERVARARCIVAQAEIALVSRELAWRPTALAQARATLERHGDRLNAAHARHLEARRLLLIGHLDEADAALATLDAAQLPSALAAAHELAAMGLAVRRLRMKPARDALARASRAAHAAAIPALTAEVESAALVLDAPAARLAGRDGDRSLRLDEIETLLASGTLVVDGCRLVVRAGKLSVSLATRPVLFALARVLAEAWPEPASRQTLVQQAFRAKRADESHRARLRVEMGRLRAELRDVAAIRATPDGFLLTPTGRKGVAVIAPPMEDAHAALALMADGEAWSSSAIGLALGISQRTVQRDLETLAAAGKVRSHGRGRARRWTVPPLPGITTTLLLLGPLPGE